jgi:Protein of unknown function (DUF3024)
MRPVLPETDVASIRELCEARVPSEAREHVRVELEQERQAVNIVECRPAWREDYGPEWSRLPVARLRDVGSERLWTLYYHRHSGRWERYPLLVPPCRRLAHRGRAGSNLRVRNGDKPHVPPTAVARAPTIAPLPDRECC